MNKSTLPSGVKTLKNWSDKNTLRFDLPIQRNSGIWNQLQKSMLVYSILNEYPVPSLYFVKYKEDSETVYQVLEGKQRCTSLFEFIDGGYALHPKTPNPTFDGKEYEIAGLTFEELPEECKDALLGFRFTIYCLEDITDSQIEEIFELINNATPLSTIQKSKAKIGTKLSKYLNELLDLSFWQESINLTIAQMKREDNLLLLLQSALLLNMKISDYNFKSISASECLNFCEYLRHSFSDELSDQLEKITIYLSDAFVGKGTIKYLRKNNVPIIAVVAGLALANNIEAQSFKAFLDDFFTTENEAYKEFSGSGNIKRVNTLGRVVELTKGFHSYFGISISDTDSKEQEEYQDSSVENTSISDNQGGISTDSVSENTESADSTPQQEKSYIECSLKLEDGFEYLAIEVDSFDEDHLKNICENRLKQYSEESGVEVIDYDWKVIEDMTEEEISEEYEYIFNLEESENEEG